MAEEDSRSAFFRKARKKISSKGKKKSPKRKGKKKVSALQKIRDSQKEADKDIKQLFKKLQKPNKTSADLKDLLSQVQKIDTSRLTGQAAQDVGRLREIATTQGPTEGAKALLAEQRGEEAGRLEDIGQAQALRGQSAFESLASRGGAGAGSRERLLAQTGRQSLLESQRERRAGAQTRAGIRSEDEGRKLGLLGALPGQQIGLAQEQRAGQTAQAQSQLAQAQQFQGASQFDESAQQQLQQFQAQGRAQGILTGQQNRQSFEATQILAKAQLAAANKQQPSPLEKFDPTGQVAKLKTRFG